MYKQASKLKLRVETNRGVLSIEQLWDLNLEDLDDLAVNLEESYKNSKGKSFLSKKTTKDKTIKLMFNIVLDILETKVEENEKALTELDKREKKQLILEKIQNVKDKKYDDMSEEELEKEYAKLDD